MASWGIYTKKCINSVISDIAHEKTFPMCFNILFSIFLISNEVQNQIKIKL